MKQTKKIALGGITAALALVILLLGGALGVATYAAPVIAAFALLPAGEMLGKKLHAVLWLSVSLLAFLLAPDPEMALLFFCPVGCYPLLRDRMQRLPKLVRLPAKLAFFLLTTLAMEALLTLLVIPEGLPLWLSAALLLAGCVVFLLYDKLLPIVKQMLMRRLSNILK